MSIVNKAEPFQRGLHSLQWADESVFNMKWVKGMFFFTVLRIKKMSFVYSHIGIIFELIRNC